jgi:hypothetical protein
VAGFAPQLALPSASDTASGQSHTTGAAARARPHRPDYRPGTTAFMADEDLARVDARMFALGDDDAAPPEVLAQIVDNMGEGEGEGEEEEMEQMVDPVLLSSVGKLGTFIPPTVTGKGSALAVVRTNEGVHVRLTLSVGASNSQLPPGLDLDDCGQCPFCLDKPKYGGAGTKRQKCELKQQEAAVAFDNRNPRVWCGLHMISEQELGAMREIQKLPLPEPITAALEEGPLPLVWAYKRKRRARTLPPAFVLMYYCEGRVELDRSHLAISRQRYFKNSRGDLGADPEKAAKARKPRSIRRPVLPASFEAFDPAPLAAVPMTPMSDPNLMWAPHGMQPAATCVYAQPVGGVSSPMYAQPPGYPPMMSVHPQPPMMQPAPYGGPPPPLYGGQPMMYDQPPPGMMYVPPPPPPLPPSSASHRGEQRASEQMMAGGMHQAPVGGGYYAPPDSYYTSLSMNDPGLAPPPQPGMHISTEHEQLEEADSWMQMESSDNPIDYAPPPPEPRSAKRKRPMKPVPPPPPPPPPQPEPAEPPVESDAMSNKTLELMLSRLQGQLPPQTYEKVISLVRDVQMRRMSLSRSEFLQHFQAICAGASKPQ